MNFQIFYKVDDGDVQTEQIEAPDRLVAGLEAYYTALDLLNQGDEEYSQDFLFRSRDRIDFWVEALD